jgi:hypothetical protein
MIVDVEPLLQAERYRCKELNERLEESKHTLDHFRDVSEPAFSRWFHSHFGEKATELRALDSRYNELSYWVSSVEKEAFLSGCSLRTAYERIERARQRRAEQDERDRNREDATNDEAYERAEFSNSESSESDESELPPGLEKELRAHFEDLFGRETAENKEDFSREFAAFKESFREEVLGQKRRSRSTHEDEDEDDGDWRSSSSRPLRDNARRDPDEIDPNRDRRRQIYRILARQLHPDVNSNLSPREKDLWNEAQSAYDSGDLDRLETLLAICESGDAAQGGMGFESIQSLSRLKSIFADFSKKLKATQKALREMKKAPAWEFSRAEKDPKKLSALTRRIQREMDDTLDELQFGIAHLSRTLEQWSRPKKRRERTGRQQSNSPTRRHDKLRREKPKRPTMSKPERDDSTDFDDRN